MWQQFCDSLGIICPHWAPLSPQCGYHSLRAAVSVVTSCERPYPFIRCLFAIYCMCSFVRVQLGSTGGCGLTLSLLEGHEDPEGALSLSQAIMQRIVCVMGGVVQGNDQVRSEPSGAAKLASPWERGENRYTTRCLRRERRRTRKPGWGSTQSAASQPAPELVNWNQPGRKDMTMESG